MDNEVAQTDSQRKFECLTEKLTEQLEQGTVQSSTGGTAMAAGRPALEDSRMRVAAVAGNATTPSTTSSTIRVVETEEQSNIECHKVLANRSDRHGTIADKDTCGTIVLTVDPEDRDGWTQQVLERNKKCCGAKERTAAGAGSTGRVDGWITKDRVDIEANLPDLGADRNGSRGKDDLWQQCNM